ncbi:MAG: DNA glycosylase AlkZ-like family protein [Candidatus Heimdallarchaeota archaeon]
MESEIIDVSKDELRKIVLVGAGLHDWQGSGKNGTREVFEQQRMVQLDPLNPAGRNHDVFFAARVSDYTAGLFEKIMYADGLVFEAYSPNLFAIHIAHYPIYRSRMNKTHMHPYYGSRVAKLEAAHPGVLDGIIDFIKENGPTQGSDLAHLGKADPSFAVWKSSRVAGAALELLWQQGKIIVVIRDKNFRKTYDLVDQYVAPEFLSDITLSDDAYNREIFKIKQQSYPLIPLGRVSRSKTGKLTLGRRKGISPTWFEEENVAVILRLEGESIGYAAPSNWEEMAKTNADGEMRALAPLDPLIYDRDTTKAVFDFEYAWEVYKKPKDRIWGYYVYPILYEGELIGRLEAKYEKQSKNLKFFNLILEKDVELDNHGETAFSHMLKRWQHMLGAEEAETDNTFPISVSD